MAIKLNEITNFTHKKPLCCRVRTSALDLRLRHLDKNHNEKPLGCQGAYIYFIAYLHIEVIKDQAYLAFDFVLYYLQKAFYLLAP